MKHFLKKVKSQFSGGVTHTFVNRVIHLISGPITLLLIPIFLSDVTQGFWFTFGSIAGLLAFADLGLTVVVEQFSAHEYAHLKLNKSKVYEGDPEHLQRLISLFRFVLRWTLIVAAIIFPIITVVGGVVLNLHESDSAWLVPWIIFIASRTLGFVISEILAFFHGTGQIGKVQTIIAISNVCMLIVKIILLVFRFNLFSLAIATALGVLAQLVFLFVFFNKPLRQLFSTKLTRSYKWFKSFVALMWKFALSALSGYLVFQIYTPLAFIAFDPVDAGRVGITLTLIMACLTFSMVWLSVANPKMNMAVSKGDWSKLERLAKKNTLLAIGTYLVGAGILLGGFAIFQSRIAILESFMPLTAVAILLAALSLQPFITGVAMFGRAHKQEPFFIVTLVTAAVSIGLTVLFVNILPIDFIFLGLLVAGVLNVPVYVIMYKKLKLKWRQHYMEHHFKKEQNMIFTRTKLDGVVEVELKSFGDNRGWFSETYNKEVFDKNGVVYNFVQDNHSYSATKGTVRALHLQNAPFAQAKLVRCVRGAIFDVAVDLRQDSPTYKQWVGVELSAENKKMLMIPRGFAHGFVTLCDDTEVMYKVDNHYNKESEVGIIFNDPDIGVEWGVEEPILSDKDKVAKVLAECNIAWDKSEVLAETLEDSGKQA